MSDLCSYTEFVEQLKQADELTPELASTAVSMNAELISYLEERWGSSPNWEECCRAAIKERWSCIKHIKAPTEEMYLLAIEDYSTALGCVPNPTDEFIEKALEVNGLCIRFLNNPSYAWQMIAVKQNGFAIQYIDNPVEEVMLQAVKTHPFSATTIKSPTEKVLVAAVSADPVVVRSLRWCPESALLAAIEQSYLYLDYAKRQTLIMCCKALEESIYALNFVNSEMLPTVLPYIEEFTKQPGLASRSIGEIIVRCGEKGLEGFWDFVVSKVPS